MEMQPLRVYTEKMRYAGEIDGYSSLVWTRRWQEPGEFSVTCPAAYASLLKPGAFVWLRGAKEAGLVESVEIEAGTEGETMTVSGRMAECLLDFRLIRGQPYTYSGTAEAATRQLFGACSPLFSTADGITLNTGEIPSGNTRVTFQATYKSLLDYEQRLCRQLALGLSLVPDFAKRTFTLRTEPGVDRSKTVVFSDRFDNLGVCVWTADAKEARTVCYVGGSGQGESRVFVLAGDDTLAGLARREALLEATAEKASGVTDDQYREQLRALGALALASELAEARAMEAEVENTPFVYGADWDLGDIVSVRRAEWGVSESMRVTEINIVFENGAARLSPVFGSPAPVVIDWGNEA